ncbi:MAG: hypothetical protein ACRCZS_20555 [Chroococcidiopsis sp.]
MPTHKLGTQTQPDPIRFKNLIGEAEEKLVATRMRSQDARDLLERTQQLDDFQFWQHQSDGLVIFFRKVDSGRSSSLISSDRNKKP